MRETRRQKWGHFCDTGNKQQQLTNWEGELNFRHKHAGL